MQRGADPSQRPSGGSASVFVVYYVPLFCGHTLRKLFLETRKGVWVGSGNEQ